MAIFVGLNFFSTAMSSAKFLLSLRRTYVVRLDVGEVVSGIAHVVRAEDEDLAAGGFGGR